MQLYHYALSRIRQEDIILISELGETDVLIMSQNL